MFIEWVLELFQFCQQFSKSSFVTGTSGLDIDLKKRERASEESSNYSRAQSPTKYDMRKKILPWNHQMSILELSIPETLSLELKVFTEPFWRKLTLKLSSIFAFTIVFWPSQGTMVEILGEACWTFWGCKSILLH